MTVNQLIAKLEELKAYDSRLGESEITYTPSPHGQTDISQFSVGYPGNSTWPPTEEPPYVCVMSNETARIRGYPLGKPNGIKQACYLTALAAALSQ